ncbi:MULTISPECIES: hypothetical protein [unclassified Rhizobium]|uniref:hypothetical protein n=1 Tax=unclassified Rhizobium TaxID=2613769 RepID=UPI001ADCC224|nr:MULTISPECIES: hypothetical protein [unclassified Rhizobium]MBO9122799.1 hypothetical protein [Rhizobium sp. 16-488-2b]MBO9173331.1 hypothetical protein [Rhizobium sp. 16-488-2a]
MLQASKPVLSSSLPAILADFGLRSLPTNQRCGASDTHAGRTLDGLLDRHGETHLSAVLRCVLSSKSPDLASDTFGAVSDVLLFRPQMPQDALEQVFATIDLSEQRKRAVRLRPWPVRQTLRAMLDSIIEKGEPSHV